MWFGLACGLALNLVVVAAAQELPARPADYIVDLAHVIDGATFQKLNGYLQALERKTGAQMIVLTVNSTHGVPIRDFGIKTAEKWKLGRKDRDNGVLIAIAIQDRKWTFEVGYGLEPTLTDAFCSRVGRDVFTPNFKKGDYSRGIYEGTLVLANAVAGAAGVSVSGMPARTMPRRTAGDSAAAGLGACVCSLLPILVLFAILSSLFGRRYSTYRYRHGSYGLWPWLLLGAMSGSRHGRGNWGGGGWGGFGGGGFGGFGGGSFGGGGGGSFGGGGASGGW